MKMNYTRITKFTLAMLILLSVQFSNVFAQKTADYLAVEKLYNEKKFTAVLGSIDPVIARYEFNYKDDKDFSEQLLILYYFRGSSRFNAIYQARMGVIFGSDTVFDEARPRFELTYNDKFIKILDEATADLKKAWEIGTAGLIAKKEDSGFAYRFKNTEFQIKKIEALTYLEKAQFVTNKNADFLATKYAFDEFEPLYSLYNSSPTSFADFDADNTRFKDAEVLAAEMRYKVALGQIDDATSLFDKWLKAKSFSLKKEPAVAAMVEAFDMVGNYKHTEGFLIREAIRQITIDKGKVIPANFTRLKSVMKSHLSNMNFAVNIPPTGKLLPFQRARLASAYNIKGNLTPAESAFIKNATDVLNAEKETPPLDTQLLSVMLKLQSTDKKESAAAKKTIDELIKKDATNAAILAVRGYSKMLSNDFIGAETDLSAAIKKDPFLAFANKAFENRALVYKKLGKADLAAKDEKENNQFQQLLSFLAAA
jgi:tetratricopeptide (TPR) repeat protein